MNEEHTGEDARGAWRLSPQDQLALDALVDSGFELDKVPQTHRARAQRAWAIVCAAGQGPADEQAAARAAQRVEAAIEGEAAPSVGDVRLNPDDEDALEAWVNSGYRTSRVPGSLRARAERLDAMAALIVAPPADVAGTSTAALVGATMGLLGQARGDRVLAFSPAPTRRVRVADLISVAALLALGTAVVWPAVSGVRSNAQRIACRGNLAEAAVGFGLYAGDHRSSLPMATASLGGTPWWNVGLPAQSNSANLFTLARARYTSPQSLSCCSSPGCASTPSCDDMDWRRLGDVTYSYRVMFGGQNPAWRGGAGTVVLADRSPVILRAARGEVIFPGENSPNHDARGQNVLFADGSARGEPTPVVDGDNLWLPRRVEDVLRAVSSRLPPGAHALVEVSGWTGASRAEPLRGTETPSDAKDRFVGP